MVDGERYECSYLRFARILGLNESDLELDKIHDFDVPDFDEAKHIHTEGASFDKYFSAVMMTPYHHYLHYLAVHSSSKGR